MTRSDTIPAPRSIDKTTLPSDGGQYGDPLSKYGPTKQVYDSTQYGMGTTTAALTFKAIKPTKAMAPELGVVVTGFTTNETTDDPRATTYSYTMLPGDLETMTKALARPRRIRRLASHLCANSAITIDTIAPRHPMPRCGHMTMMATTFGCALTPRQDGLPCKPR